MFGTPNSPFGGPFQPSFGGQPLPGQQPLSGQQFLPGQQPSSEVFFGPNGQTSTVFHSGGNAFTVVGSQGNDGLYTRSGNTVVGPNGVSTIVDNGSTQMVFGPDGVHTVLRNPGGGGTIL